MTKREEIQKNATNSIIKNRFLGLLNVSPRVGKCKITIDALNNVSKSIDVLILAPKKPILEDWKKEIDKWGLQDKILIDFSWSNSLKKIDKDYHLIIADEYHDYNLKVITELRKHQKKGTRILGLSGTPDEQVAFNYKNILRLESIFEYPFHQAIKDGIIADYEIECFGLNLDNEDRYIASGTLEKQFYQTELEAYTYWNTIYNKKKALQRYGELRFPMMKRIDIIYNSRTKIKKTKELISNRTLIFTGRQEVANIFGSSFHSKSDKSNLEKFKEGSINCLSVIGMVSMGITFPNLKHVVFNQLKSVESLAIQQSMRAMNLDSGEKAKIQIIYLKNTQDEEWLKVALASFEKEKIKYYDEK